jgi:uroporphyrin-III C-methyltransferase/precorrin-2 dehydrogenase/sirohydrochlorin ferrochelatase
MHSLPIFLNLVGRPVIVIGDGEAARAKRRLLHRAGAIIVAEAEPANLAIIALDDDKTATDAAERLRRRSILVNVVDRPALCDFTLPAIVDRDPVLIAIGTGGRSAGLAKVLRQRLEALLPARLGALADALFAARPMILRQWPDATDRRHAIDAALAAGGRLDPEDADATAHVESWLSGGWQAAPDRCVTIALRSTDPDDLTIREARLLGQADRIYHPADMPAAILDRARADAERIMISPTAVSEGPGLSIWLEWA